MPTFAFPGAHDGFFTQNEINNYNLTKFQQLLIWGVNVTCQSINGTLYPADTSGSYYSCGNDHLFYPNTESSLKYQSKELKQIISTNTTILSYIIFDSAQQSYIYQNIFNSPSNSNSSYHCEF